MEVHELMAVGLLEYGDSAGLLGKGFAVAIVPIDTNGVTTEDWAFKPMDFLDVSLVFAFVRMPDVIGLAVDLALVVAEVDSSMVRVQAFMPFGNQLTTIWRVEMVVGFFGEFDVVGGELGMHVAQD